MSDVRETIVVGQAHWLAHFLLEASKSADVQRFNSDLNSPQTIS